MTNVNCTYLHTIQHFNLQKNQNYYQEHAQYIIFFIVIFFLRPQQFILFLTLLETRIVTRKPHSIQINRVLTNLKNHIASYHSENILAIIIIIIITLSVWIFQLSEMIGEIATNSVGQWNLNFKFFDLHNVIGLLCLAK